LKEPFSELSPAQKPKQPDPPKQPVPNGSAKMPPAKKTLKELFSALAPAVPVVEIPGGGGSGFLVRHERDYLVVTNRHVINSAYGGLKVLFVYTTKQGKKQELPVPKEMAKLVAVHKELDLALIDVTPAAAELAECGIQPVPLAKADHVTAVGEHIFAI